MLAQHREKLAGAVVLAVAFSFGAASVQAAAGRAVLTRHPRSVTLARVATFAWRPAARTALCRLDRGPWRRCASPRRYRGLRPGRHRFSVRLTRRSPVTSFVWTVRRPPVISSPAPTPAPAPAPATSTTGTPSTGVATDAKRPTRPADYVVLVDWDGFDPSLLQRGWSTPNLDALASRGSRSIARSTFTSFSNPARASMSTGAYPERHGNVAWTFDPATNVVLGQTRELDVESIAESLRRSTTGLTEASVQWYMVQNHGVTYGDPAHLYVQPGGDFGHRVDVAIDILNRRPVSSNGTLVTVPRIPNFLAVYSSDPDSVEHEEGLNGPDLRPLIEQQDRDLGRLVQATKDVGIYGRTAFILTTDHGMTDWTKTALPLLRQTITDAGYSNEVVYVDQSPAPDTEVVISPAVRVAHLALRGAAATTEGRAAIRSALEAHSSEFERVLGPNELAALHASLKLGDLVVEARPPWSFAKADLTPGTAKAAHGSEDELNIPLLLSGSGIGSTAPSQPGLVDVAPTIAALLSAPCPAQAQGRPLSESLTTPASCG